MEHPGKIELKRILNCMKDYEYDDSLEPGKFDGSYILNLQKRVDYSSDETIKVTIEFSTVFDDKNTYKKDAYENFLYNDKNNKKAYKFINKLMKDDSPKKGGQRKTRKNK
jgi:ABC-type phosphate transport system ATPase subunit